MTRKKSQDINRFYKKIDTAAKIILEHVENEEFIRIVSHLDADGISAASIIGRALSRIEATFSIRIVKQLNEKIADDLIPEEGSLIIFTDLGSGSLDVIKAKFLKNKTLVLDHHEPVDISPQNLCHVNPHLFGFDGSKEISGAGVAYLVSKTLDKSNIDTASLAVVGALGDVQDRNEKRGLMGLNESIVKDAIESGYMQVETDLIFYGRETRPIHKAIAYTTNPFIPGLSGEEDKCFGFLRNLGINLKDNDRWRAIGDLSTKEKQIIFSEIAKHLSTKGFSNAISLNLIGTVYILTKEERWTPLRDAREHASLLNACGRMKKSGLGVIIGIGSRGKTLDNVKILFNDYKRALSKQLDWLTKTPQNTQILENINVVDGSGVISELMIGTIASILTSNNSFNNTKPVIAFTTAENKTVKVSGRIPNVSINDGLNLGVVFQIASSQFYGRGGGHKAAAGAQLPKGTEKEFIKSIDQQIGVHYSEIAS